MAALRATPQEAAEAAIRSVGLGFDVVRDVRLKYCKQRGAPDPWLIELDHGEAQDIVLPGGVTVAGVTKSVKCDKGERMRFRSDVLSFQQMSEQFNQELSLSGKIPSGFFNTMFEFSGSWQKDAANTKTLAFDGWYVTLYSVALSKGQIVLRDHVKQAVPSTWEPAALARFIEKFGTHIVVGLKMGGKDVIYLKQQHSSTLQAADVQKRLKEMSDRKFFDANGQSDMGFKDTYGNNKSDIREQQLRFVQSSPLNSYSSTEDLVMMPKRRGGRDKEFISHSEWLNTVQAEPDVISMSFIPITSLLNGVPGSGFLNHAINLYLRHKPPIEELHQFLEFQLPRQWAPVYSDLALGPQRKRQSSTSLPVNIIGPKLYICTNMIDNESSCSSPADGTPRSPADDMRTSPDEESPCSHSSTCRRSSSILCRLDSGQQPHPRNMDDSKDAELLRILGYARMHQKQINSRWYQEDAVLERILKTSAINSMFPGIDLAMLKQRIQEFEKMVIDYYEGKLTTMPNQDLMLYVFSNIMHDYEQIPETPLNSGKRATLVSEELEAPSTKRARSESVDMVMYLSHPDAASKLLSSGFSMEDCTSRAQRLFKDDHHMLYSALTLLRQNIEIRQSFMTLQESYARGYIEYELKDSGML